MPSSVAGQGSSTNAAMFAMAAEEDQVEDGHIGFVQDLAHLTEHTLQMWPVLFQDVHKDPGTGAPAPLHPISGTLEILAVNEHGSICRHTRAKKLTLHGLVAPAANCIHAEFPPVQACWQQKNIMATLRLTLFFISSGAS